MWKVEGITQEQAEDLLHAMTRAYGGDPAATDSTRVLRLPGFHNKKYPENYRVEAHLESTKLYHFSDFRVPTREHERSPLQRDLSYVPGRDSSVQREQRTITQSERDWSYALRNLNQGMAPSEVIEQIAAFRSDKPDPRYYAEHTVQKALAELGERRGPHSAASAEAESRGDTEDRRP